MSVSAKPWFGAFDFSPGERGTWQVGPLRLCVWRESGEWRVLHHEEGDPLAAEVRVEFAPAGPSEEGEAGATRYVVGEASRRLYLQPMLPDRAVVTRPVSPVFIPGGESARFYVSVPLWLRLEEGEPRRVLEEFPTQRPSDTWFGPPAGDGEMCYAIRSRCRLVLTEQQFLPHRAITPVVIRNHHTEALGLESIKVPVRQLSLYAEDQRQLWTEELALERSEDKDFAAIKVTPGAPPEAKAAERLTAARDPLQRKTVIRAFSALFQ